MLAAPGVSCVCSDVPRSNPDRVRVENALGRSIRVTANGADDVRTIFWRTTPLRYLILIDYAHVLPALYGRVVVPPAVVAELNQQRTPDLVRSWLAGRTRMAARTGSNSRA